MNYLYSQDCIGNSVEGCSAGFFVPGRHSLLTYNRNVARLWTCNQGLVLVKEHILPESIRQVERYSLGDAHDGVIFLFDRAKITLAAFDVQKNEFRALSLKFFERAEFDIREEDVRMVRTITGIGMLQISKYWFSIFPLHPNTFGARAFKFSDIGGRVRNPVDFVFLENYSMPTVCLVYNSSPRRYTSVVNSDAVVFSIDLSAGRFHIVDEFAVPPRTSRVFCSGAVLLFVSPNTVLLRSTSSAYTLPLNAMSEAVGQEATGDVVLSDVNCFFIGMSCLVFNGNGDRFRLKIAMDIKRIINATIEFEGRESVVSCVGSVGEILFLGSLRDSSRLFRIRSCDRAAEKMEEPTEDEYARMFTADAARPEGSFSMQQLDEVAGVGVLNGMFMRTQSEAVCVSEGLHSSLCIVSSNMKLDVVKAVKIRRYLFCSRAFDLYLLSNLGESRVFRWDEGLQEAEGEHCRDGGTLLFAELGDRIVHVTQQCCMVLDRSLAAVFRNDLPVQIEDARVVGQTVVLRDVESRLTCFDASMGVVVSMSDVTCVADIGSMLFVLSGDRVTVFDLDKRVNLFCSDPVGGLPGCIRFSRDLGSGLMEGRARISEMCCYSTDRKLFLLLRTDVGMVVYESQDAPLDSEDAAELVFFKAHLSRCVVFHPNRQGRTFHRSRGVVFVKGVVHVFLVPTDRGLFLYKSQYSLNCLSAFGDQTVQLSKGYLALCDAPAQDGSAVFCSSHVVRMVPAKRIPKHIEHAGRYIAVASCEEAQKQDGECGSVSCRFHVDLYSAEYKHICSYALDENEYVFYVRHLVLDDKQGNNGKSPFLVLCTTFVEGEDRPARGRLHVLEIISVVPDLENPFMDCKLKVLGVEKTKGSIMQCEEIRGSIVLCLGTKIMVYRVDRSKGIVPVGFHDLHMFTSSISVAKNYIAAADIHKGLSFFYLQSRPVRLHLLSASEPLRNVTSLELLATDDELSMVCSDDSGGIHAYTYSPNNILSLEGTRLVKRTEIRTRLGRLFSCRVGFRHGSIAFCSRSNVLVQISGVEDSSYYRLLGVQETVAAHLGGVLGLNTKDHLDSDIHLPSLSLRTPIVLHVLNAFFWLDADTQDAVCAAAGMGREEVAGLIAACSA